MVLDRGDNVVRWSPQAMTGLQAQPVGQPEPNPGLPVTPPWEAQIPVWEVPQVLPGPDQMDKARL